MLAEEERLVHLLLTEDDEILECSAQKRVQHLLDHLMAEVASLEDTGVMPPNVTNAEQKVDVGWYGDTCADT